MMDGGTRNRFVPSSLHYLCVASSSPMASHEHALRKATSFIATCLLPLYYKPKTLFDSFHKKLACLYEEGHENSTVMLVFESFFTSLGSHLACIPWKRMKNECNFRGFLHYFQLVFFQLKPLVVKKMWGGKVSRQ